VSSLSYQMIRDAMEARQQVHATYGGFHRELSVHEIGLGPNGNDQIMAYQFGGESSKGPVIDQPEESRWRCFDVGQLSDLVIVDGPWHTAVNRGRGNTCIVSTDYEIHP